MLSKLLQVCSDQWEGGGGELINLGTGFRYAKVYKFSEFINSQILYSLNICYPPVL